jgi:hypothetical protein
MTAISPYFEQEIQKYFAGAKKTSEYLTDLAQRVSRRVQIPYDKILYGQSICVDDIINTKNPIEQLPVFGPFNFGGLAGVPFVGKTGVDAFLHHVPDEGCAYLFCAPHIGISESGEWGKILRHGQAHLTTCCGAAYGALAKLQSGEQSAPDEEDYQQQVLERLAWQHRKQILQAEVPLIAFTQIIYQYAEGKLIAYLREEQLNCRYLVYVGGIIINTDWQYPDYVLEQRRVIVEVATHQITQF